MSEVIPSTKWFPQDGFLRPKLNTDGLYIGVGAAPTTPFGGESAVFEQDTTAFFNVISHSAAAYFIGIPTQGDSATPTATTTGQWTAFTMGGYGDTGYTAGSLPGLYVQATDTWTDSDFPTAVFIGDQVTGTPLTVNFNTADTGDLYLNTTGGQIAHTDWSADRFYLGVADNSYFDINGLLALADGAVSTPSLANVGDLDTGIYFPSANVLGVTAEGVAQGIFSNPTTAAGSILELASSDRTFGASISAVQNFINVDNTYTLNATNAVLPVGYNFQPTVIFSADGYGFGSGFLFWNHMLVQNNSGSTRNIGGIGSYIDQVNVQANGGSIALGFHVGFLGQPTLNRINSGTMTSLLGIVEFWSNSPVVGAGVTLPSVIHFLASGASNSGTVTNQVGFASSGMTAATNNTDFLIGTQTTGNWGIYQSTTTLNHFSGDVEVPDEAYGSSWNGVTEVPTKNAIYDALNVNGKGFINHGATAGTARPVGFASVTWYGSVEPTNMITGDEWIEA